MEGYNSEEQQLEQLKQWWKKNGNSVVMAVLVALVAMFGTRLWMNSQEAKRVEASALYDALITDLEQENYQGVMERGGILVSQLSGTPYAAMAALAMAKAKHDQGDLPAAQNYLQWVVDNAKDAGMKHIARLRLAQVLWAQDQGQAALDLLSGVDPGTFVGSYEELRGDILLSLGRADDAKQAYTVAMGSPDYAGDKRLLEMKLEGLGGIK